MTDPKPLSARRAALLDVLNRELPPGEKMHGWRCEHPDRYPKPCDCANTMADIIEDALDDAARAARPEPGADLAGLEALYDDLLAFERAFQNRDADMLANVYEVARRRAADLRRSLRAALPALAALPASPEPHAWCESCGYAHPVGDRDCVDAALPASPEDGLTCDGCEVCVGEIDDCGCVIGHEHTCAALPASPEDGLDVERLRDAGKYLLSVLDEDDDDWWWRSAAEDFRAALGDKP